jgi:hypothetical protein
MADPTPTSKHRMLVTRGGRVLFSARVKSAYLNTLRAFTTLSFAASAITRNQAPHLLTPLAAIYTITNSCLALSCHVVTPLPRSSRRLTSRATVTSNFRQVSLTVLSPLQSHRVARLSLLTTKAVFAESGLYDHFLNTLAKSLTLRLLGHSVAKLASSSPLESVSTLVYRLSTKVTQGVSALSTWLGATKRGVGALNISHVFVVLALVIPTTLTLTLCLLP